MMNKKITGIITTAILTGAVAIPTFAGTITPIKDTVTSGGSGYEVSMDSSKKNEKVLKPLKDDVTGSGNQGYQLSPDTQQAEIDKSLAALEIVQ